MLFIQDHDDANQPSCPIALYCVERTEHTVAFLLYAYPDANLGMPALALRILSKRLSKRSTDLKGESLATFSQLGE